MADFAEILTEGEIRFCEEYAADPNATQAYRRAYPAATYKTARTEGSRLLADPDIKAVVDAIRHDYRRGLRIDTRRTLREAAGIAHADLGDLFEADPDNGGLPKPRKWSDVPPSTRKAIQTTKITRRRLCEKGRKGETTEWEVESLEFKLFPKMDAIKTLCAYLGLTTDAPAFREALEHQRREEAAEQARQAAPPVGEEGGGVPPGA